jgi:diguanylate cyclase (GGDEF)-like protein
MNAADHEKICPRILIVDDNADHCELLSDALGMYYRFGPDSCILAVHTASACLEQPLKDFDLVLLDLHLPDISGLEVLEEILTRADVPVIFVTGDQDISVAAEAIQRGAQDYVVKHGDYLFAIPVIVEKNIALHKIKLEHDRLELRLQWMLEELKHKNQQLEESMEKLKRMATTDALTGLNNRRYFSEQLERQFSEAVRYDTDLCCCMIDLDHYKQLNDSLGHQVGDEILQLMARRIDDCLRSSDIAARYGGDEFVLLLPHTSSAEAHAVVRRLRESMAEVTREHAKIRTPVTLSIGVASLRDDFPATADALVSMADRALYRAKELGKDRIMAFRDLRDDSNRQAS